MDIINSDIDHTRNVLNGIYTDNYSRIYFNSNEDINILFNNFNVNNKTGLSILSSGDQAFHLLNRNVKNIDLFDKNKLTIYYYYLRIWIINYLNSFYSLEDLNIQYISDLLNKVNPHSDQEKEVYDYWKKFINVFHDFDINSLFEKNNLYINKINDLDFLKSKLNNSFNFYNIDIKEEINSDKKYDFIYISNVLEWIIRSKDDLCVVRDNLYNLLNEDGFVICSNVCKNGNNGIGSLIFEKNFDCYRLPYVKMKNNNKYFSPGYYYKKKVI